MTPRLLFMWKQIRKSADKYIFHSPKSHRWILMNFGKKWNSFNSRSLFPTSDEILMRIKHMTTLTSSSLLHSLCDLVRYTVLLYSPVVSLVFWRCPVLWCHKVLWCLELSVVLEYFCTVLWCIALCSSVSFCVVLWRVLLFVVLHCVASHLVVECRGAVHCVPYSGHNTDREGVSTNFCCLCYSFVILCTSMIPCLPQPASPSAQNCC